MLDVVVVAIFIDQDHFEAALARQSNPPFERFENTAGGVQQFAKWLAKVSPTKEIDSCVAVSKRAGKSAYESPVFQFAYDGTRSTFVWSPAQVETLPPSNDGNTASRMLTKCATEHARRSRSVR